MGKRYRVKRSTVRKAVLSALETIPDPPTYKEAREQLKQLTLNEFTADEVRRVLYEEPLASHMEEKFQNRNSEKVIGFEVYETIGIGIVNFRKQGE